VEHERTLVIGDIHGADRALHQALERAGFAPATDRLICLGDICDRGPEVDLCIDSLLGLGHILLVRGNHDDWALEWMRNGWVDPAWLTNGGLETLDAYARRAGLSTLDDLEQAAALAAEVPPEHIAFLEAGADFHLEALPDGRLALFTHAGWNPRRSADEQTDEELRWSKAFWRQARKREPLGDPVTDFDVVFVGHNTTHEEWSEPRRVLEVWNLDQGAGWGGSLTVMDAVTEQWWQSDPVRELYGEDGD
jgi:serine/threonine protein phosphatase 1